MNLLDSTLLEGKCTCIGSFYNQNKLFNLSTKEIILSEITATILRKCGSVLSLVCECVLRTRMINFTVYLWFMAMVINILFLLQVRPL